MTTRWSFSAHIFCKLLNFLNLRQTNQNFWNYALYFREVHLPSSLQLVYPTPFTLRRPTFILIITSCSFLLTFPSAFTAPRPSSPFLSTLFTCLIRLRTLHWWPPLCGWFRWCMPHGWAPSIGTCGTVKCIYIYIVVPLYVDWCHKIWLFSMIRVHIIADINLLI